MVIWFSANASHMPKNHCPFMRKNQVPVNFPNYHFINSFYRVGFQAFIIKNRNMETTLETAAIRLSDF